jgi:hypothetical protein
VKLRLTLSAALLSLFTAMAGAESPLSLGPGDLRIEQLTDGGYHLYVRAKKGLSSILLTESTKDPEQKEDSFAYRALERNAVNGDEKRLLAGKSKPEASDQHFLIDSSPESDPAFGRAFHIFIPWVVAWGYPWSRSGKVFIHDGTFINIRAFAKPYADYSGGFADNPYLVRVTQAAKAPKAKAVAPPPAASAPKPAPAEAAPPQAPSQAAAPPAPPTVAPSAPTPVAAPVVTAKAAPPPAPSQTAESAAPTTPPAPPKAAPKPSPAPAAPAPKPAPAPTSTPTPSPAAKAAPAPAPSAPAPVQAKALAKKAPDAKLYIPETLTSFGAIAQANGGELVYAASDKDIAARIDELLARKKGASLDLVLCIDVTDTMINGLEDMRTRLPALLAKRLADFPSFRIGAVAYKDYFEEYLYKRFDFTRDLAAFSADLEALHCGGGRDIPEAVYEALYAAGTEFPWEAEARLVILIGDAPPHPLPRGSVGEAEVEEATASSHIEVDAVAVPK